ncbi:hypothetical protein CIP101841_02130 [Corynebacterium diphtheriae]|nr:hypothetical protein CIP101841_02130 [Corynebacterium diphtheriae]CAB1025926.1 hypothetical protein FRC0515_02282 [Corynebacterium diphtheriae]CAB1027460.1 hypothetical protein FRC0547_00038 [Corynebacterium diphtheriae]
MVPPSDPHLRFVNAPPRFTAESYLPVVKPSLSVPVGQGIVDAISEEYFEMLDVSEIGLRKVSVPEVECFWIWMVGVPAHSRR